MPPNGDTQISDYFERPIIDQKQKYLQLKLYQYLH